MEREKLLNNNPLSSPTFPTYPNCIVLPPTSKPLALYFMQRKTAVITAPRYGDLSHQYLMYDWMF